MFTKKPVPADHDLSVYVYTKSSRVFNILGRTYNQNVVISEAQLDTKNRLIGISQYWLDVDPLYKEAARKKNKIHDRAEFGLLDTQTYGINIIDKLSPKEWIISFKRFPSENMKLKVVKNRVILLRHMDTQRVWNIFVHSTSNFVGLPTVKKIDIIYYNIKSQEKRVDTIVI